MSVTPGQLLEIGAEPIRNYLANELGVENVGILPARELVLAAGSALLDGDESFVPPLNDRQLVGMRMRRKEEADGRIGMAGLSQIVYSKQARELLGFGGEGAHAGSLAEAIRTRLPEQPHAVQFQQAVGTAFAHAALSSPVRVQTVHDREAARQEFLGLLDAGGMLRTLLEQRTNPNLLEINPRMGRVLEVLGEQGLGLVGRCCLLTSSEFVGTAARELVRETPQARGVVGVEKTEDLAQALEDMRRDGERFDVVDMGNLGSADKITELEVVYSLPYVLEPGAVVQLAGWQEAREGGMYEVFLAAQHTFGRHHGNLQNAGGGSIRQFHHNPEQ